MAMQSNWQNLNYIAKYGNVKQRPKSTHWVVKYGDKVLTNPATYALAQISIKEFRMMGQFSDKSKLRIVGI
jgi:hypothetical protein